MGADVRRKPDECEFAALGRPLGDVAFAAGVIKARPLFSACMLESRPGSPKSCA